MFEKCAATDASEVKHTHHLQEFQEWIHVTESLRSVFIG